MIMSALAGAFLVARPRLRDAAFGRTVILLLQHGEDGAFGLVLNRQAETNDLPFPIFVGGPCQLQGLLMLHGHADWASESDESAGEVVAGVYLGDSASFDRLAEMPEGAAWKFKVFAGYSGWAPQQLETEMSEGAWIVLPGSAEHVFETPVDELWDRLAPPTIPEPSLN
jgi:putative transcriptional regulator